MESIKRIVFFKDHHISQNLRENYLEVHEVFKSNLENLEFLWWTNNILIQIFTSIK